MEAGQLTDRGHLSEILSKALDVDELAVCGARGGIEGSRERLERIAAPSVR